MINKYILAFLQMVLFCLTANAEFRFESNKKYSLSCSRAGYVALGNNHKSSYPIYYVTGDNSIADDGYWYISGDEEQGFLFRNAYTGEYLTWSSDYSTYRYLDVTSTLTDACYWNIEYDTGNNCLKISTVNAYRGSNDGVTTNYYFNVRSTNQVGTYRAYDTSGHFHIYDENGNEVKPTADPASFDSSENSNALSDHLIFADWTSKNQYIDNSSSSHTITFNCYEGSVLHFDWSVSSGHGDTFTATLDGSQIFYIDGITSDSYTSDPLAYGQHTLVFTYEKDERGAEYDDLATASNIEVTYGKEKTITFHCVNYNNNVEFDTQSENFYGTYTISEFPTFSNYDFYSATAQKGATYTESADIYVYYIKSEGKLNIVPTTITKGQFAADTKWYRMSVRSGKQVHTSGAQVLCNTYDTPYDPAYFWCFVQSGTDQYRIYNYSTGASAPMSVASTNSSTEALMSSKGSYNTFILTTNPGGGFNIQLPKSVASAACFNDYSSQGVLKLWNHALSPNDGGSCFNFELVGSVEFISVEELSVKGSSDIYIFEKDQERLSYNYAPANATLMNVEWSSSNPKVASVDAYGYVTGLSAGTTVITVALQNNPSVYAQWTIHVEGLIRVGSITAPETLQLGVGDSYTISYTVEPATAYDKTVTIRSSNPDVVYVEPGGRLTALAEGTSIITISANDDSGVTARCVVTVADKEKGTLVEHSDEYVYLTSGGNALLALPKDYISGDYTLNDNGVFTATLKTGTTFSRIGILSATEELPVELPTFTSYKFNNKFNYQVFSDIVVEDPTASEINIAIAGIGKRLTASFQVPDKDVVVWAEGERQVSKECRPRFDHPITYTIGRDAWVELQLLQMNDGSYTESLIPFGHHTTVNIDWLTDKSYANYGVPEVYIMTDDGNGITSKTEYKTATIAIEGGGAFPDFANMAVLVKGRGNSSWGGWGSKNPYRLKFEKKQSPLGLPKSKSWVLLANKQTGSMTTNAIGQKVASIMESASACHIIPIELYINGIYQGSYNFTEKVGFSNSSVDLDDESYAAMMELDTYSETNNTPPLTYNNAYYLAAKIHEPDIYDKDEFGQYIYTGELTVEGILNDFDRMTQAVRYGGDYDRYVDVPSLVSYLATSELNAHCELMHPKSAFCYSENVTDGFNLEGYDETPWVFGPMWDCDWAFGYEQNHTYFVNSVEGDYFNYLLAGRGGSDFWRGLRFNSPVVNTQYLARWHKFMKEGGLDELLEFCDDYYAFAARSLSHNNDGTYAYDKSDYATVTANSKSWLRRRANYIYSTLLANAADEAPYRPSSSFEVGDTNADGLLTTVDLTRLMRIALGLAIDTYGTADLNCDGIVDRQDIEALAHKILDKK